jgi:RNA polymerase sigma-70 factor (ECF subfamily)
VKLVVSDHRSEDTGRAAPGGTEAEALAARAVARDPEAWSAIFDAHYRPVFSFVRYRLRRTEEAEDIASQVFEIAYARADRFDYRGVPIEAWLIGIARNLVRDHIKKIGRRGYEEELMETTAPSLPDASEIVDLRQDLAAAMQALTEDQQTVLSLRFILDKSVADTARLMERSEDAVKNLQRRALAAMQRALADLDYTGNAAR